MCELRHCRDRWYIDENLLSNLASAHQILPTTISLSSTLPTPPQSTKSIRGGQIARQIEDSHRRTCPSEFKIAINFRAAVRHTFTLFFGCFSRLTSIHASEAHDRRFEFSHFTFITCLCTHSRMRGCCCCWAERMNRNKIFNFTFLVKWFSQSSLDYTRLSSTMCVVLHTLHCSVPYQYWIGSLPSRRLIAVHKTFPITLTSIHLSCHARLSLSFA